MVHAFQSRFHIFLHQLHVWKVGQTYEKYCWMVQSKLLSGRVNGLQVTL